MDYTLDNSNAAMQALDPGETLIDTSKVATMDGTTQVATITIHGRQQCGPNDVDNLARGQLSTTPIRPSRLGPLDTTASQEKETRAK